MEFAFPKRSKCETCGRTFGTESLLRQHALTHTGVKFHRCSECTRSFNQRIHLTRHIDEVHRGIRKTHVRKKLKCSQCDRQFTHNSDLRKHQNVHKEEKKFECTECLRKFFTQTTLEKHALLHDDSRPFICQHSDESDLLVSQCTFSSKTKTSLLKHVERHHSGAKVRKRIDQRQQEVTDFFRKHKVQFLQEKPFVFSLSQWSNLNVIFEVDEFQNKDRLVMDELKRMDTAVSLSGNEKATLFIRFNPDAYKIINPKGRVTNGNVKLSKRFSVLQEFLSNLSDLVLPWCSVAYFFYSYDKRHKCACLFANENDFYEEREMTPAERRALLALKPSVIHTSF